MELLLRPVPASEYGGSFYAVSGVEISLDSQNAFSGRVNSLAKLQPKFTAQSRSRFSQGA